jgi:hypothetical protein
MAETTTLQEAVVGLVHDGDSVALEGSPSDPVRGRPQADRQA